MSVRNIWLVVKLPSNQRNPLREGRENTNGATNFERDASPKAFYVNENDATAACTQLAQQNPMTPYAVMAISRIFETGRPEVIRKQFTPEGELIIV